jgi:predicted RNA-binding Zn-ribbon protein involved in translation (DUF1610 family)
MAEAKKCGAPMWHVVASARDYVIMSPIKLCAIYATEKEVCSCGWVQLPSRCDWHSIIHCPDCGTKIVRAAQTTPDGAGAGQE